MQNDSLEPLSPGEPAPLGRYVGSYGVIEKSGLVIQQPSLFSLEDMFEQASPPTAEENRTPVRTNFVTELHRITRHVRDVRG